MQLPISFYVTSKKLSKIRPASAAQCSCNLQKHSTILRDFMHTKNPAKKLPMWSHFFSKLLRVPLTFVSSVVYWTSEVYPQFCYLKNLRLLCTFFDRERTLARSYKFENSWGDLCSSTSRKASSTSRKASYFIFSMNYFIFSIKYFIEFMKFLRSESLEKSWKVSKSIIKSPKMSNSRSCT